MGGRGAGSVSRNRSGGGGQPIDTRDLISERESKRQLVDETLATLRDFSDEYKDTAYDIVLATMDKRGQSTMAYSDGQTIGVNEAYFSKNIEKAYKECVKSGFHPSNGNKTAIQATIAHEMGHNLTDTAATKMGIKGLNKMETAADRIVKEARQNTKHKGVVIMASKISRYATTNNAETIAEAVADVYCNGNKAKAESKAVVDVLKKYLK